ncbi:MAG: XRE family transcriptional regulator [Jatrophihabitantaceae bacterium]
MPPHTRASELPSDQARAAHVEFQPEWAVAPGTLLRAELDARGMTQTDLAARTQLTEKHVSQVMTGTVTLSADVALAFERSLGVPARTLLLAEARHQAEESGQTAFRELAQHESWARHFPITVLKKNGYLQGNERGGQLVDCILRFFGVAEPKAFEEVSLAGISGFRRAQHLQVNEYATATWLRLGELQTARHHLPPFSADRLRRSLSTLRALTSQPDGEAFTLARRQLASCGVALAFVDGVNESRAWGATRWVTASRPVIVLSDRYPFRDSLWFSLMHEIGHVLRHPKRRTFVNLADDGDDNDGLEAEANDFAAETLVPSDYRDQLMTVTSQPEFDALAAQVGVDVSIVAGQAGHRTGDWRRVQRLRKKLDVPALDRAAHAPLDESAPA